MLQKLYEDLSPVRNNIYVLMCDNADLDVFLYPGMNIIHYPKNKFDFNFLSNILTVLSSAAARSLMIQSIH